MEEKHLEEIRNQFAILKQQVDKQAIISEQLLRSTMKAKKKTINKNKTLAYVCVVFCLVIYPLSYFSPQPIWSLPFIIATCILMLFCAAATNYIHKPVDRLNFVEDDFSKVARVMAKFKKQYDNWLHYVTPIIITPWIIWACYEVGWRYAPQGSNPWFLILPIVIGGAVGGLFGYLFHRKTVNAAKSILEDIEKL